MINTKPTPRHIENIKKHKRFLEKWEMWEYAYFDGEEYYFLNQYIQMGKVKGYLILNKNGEIVPFEKARAAAYIFVRYNTMMHQTIVGLIPQMHKTINPLKELVSLLKTNRSKLMEINPSIEQSVDKIIEFTTQNIKGHESIRDIVNTLGTYQLQITKETGFFDQDFFHTMVDEYRKYEEIMYTFGLREQELNSDYQKVLDILKHRDSNKISKSDKYMMKTILDATIKSNKEELIKSMRTFEIDEDGNEINIDVNNVKESLANKKEKQAKKDFEKIIVPQLRNPK